MNTATILIVDDEPQIRRVLSATLSRDDYTVIEAGNGEEAVELLMREHPDLILLDSNMPGMSGLETCRRIRLSFEGPIIMLTVRNGQQDKITALDSGADDYVVKPFPIEELRARIRAGLRRFELEHAPPHIMMPEMEIDFERRTVLARGKRVHLTRKEFEVLRVLASQAGKPISHSRLTRMVWGPDYGDETENLRVVVRQLRSKIEKDPAHPRYILTEPWVGYRFQIASVAAEKNVKRKSSDAAVKKVIRDQR